MCNLVIVDSGYMNVKAYGGHVVSRKVNLLSWDLISYSANWAYGDSNVLRLGLCNLEILKRLCMLDMYPKSLQ